MKNLQKKSKKYNPFLYWWDITPRRKKKLDQYENIEFIQKDTGQRCIVPTKELKAFLTKDRRTSRSEGNWGIKVLMNHPDELAFEPGSKDGEWLYLPVVWKDRGDRS